jgi:molybdenum cofactor guanylyltransferase
MTLPRPAALTLPELPLAAILAGGRSRRFGAPKALAELEGRPLLQWVREAVAEVIPDPVLITNDAEAFRAFGLPTRGDAVPGAGPLGGIHSALQWAAELGRPGALCVACDTPFLAPALLRRLIDRFTGSDADMVAPESTGPLGVEPLCAIYRTGCLAEVTRRLEAGEHALGGLVAALATLRLPLAEVRSLADPETVFHNVNTREQFATALRIARTDASA